MRQAEETDGVGAGHDMVGSRANEEEGIRENEDKANQNQLALAGGAILNLVNNFVCGEVIFPAVGF